jgi:hypothetical protein
MRFVKRGTAIGIVAIGLLDISIAVGCSSTGDGGRTSSPSAPSPAPAPAAKADLSRPANVPAEFVATPSGYVHPSCVVEVGSDERLGANGIVRKDGSIRAVPTCAFERYDRQGKVQRPSSASTLLADEKDGGYEEPYEMNYWQMHASKSQLPPLSFISATWTVPRAPLADRGHVFYFPGLESYRSDTTILQPVLGTYTGQWTIASWNCCVNDVPLHSQPINVSPGDVIYGSVTGTECDERTGVCAKWDVLTRDDTTGESTTLHTTSYGLPMNWAFAGVLEVWDIDHCAGLVPDGQMRFSNVVVRDLNGAPVRPAWEPNVVFDVCGYDVQVGSSSATLKNTPVLQPKPPRPASCGRIDAGEGLTLDSIYSCDRLYSLTMRPNGELTFDRGGFGGAARLWTSKVTTEEAFVAMMQPDGNFVIKDMAGATVWSTATGGHPGAYVSLADGTLTIHDANGVQLWSAETSTQ